MQHNVSACVNTYKPSSETQEESGDGIKKYWTNRDWHKLTNKQQILLLFLFSCLLWNIYFILIYLFFADNIYRHGHHLSQKTVCKQTPPSQHMVVTGNHREIHTNSIRNCADTGKYLVKNFIGAAAAESSKQSLNSQWYKLATVTYLKANVWSVRLEGGANARNISFCKEKKTVFSFFFSTGRCLHGRPLPQSGTFDPTAGNLSGRSKLQ